MFKVKMLVSILAVFALTTGSALAADPVPIFAFNPATLELTIDTQGDTLETWTIIGPDAMAGLNDPPFNTLKTVTIPNVGTFTIYDWETQFFGGSMQTFDNANGLITDGSNVEYSSPTILYAVYPSGTTLGSFGGVNYFATDGGSGSTTVEAIPEPATMSLLGLGGLALLRRRKTTA